MLLSLFVCTCVLPTMLGLSGKRVWGGLNLGKFCRGLSRFDKIVVSAEVRGALSENKPVVALESTIITHGMPFPQNVKCALEVEEVVRSQVLEVMLFYTWY